MTKIQFRLLDFHVSNEEQQKEEESSEDEPVWDENQGQYVGGKKERKDNKIFTIEAFGKNEKGETYSLLIENFEPFFYIRVGDHWTNSTKNKFFNHLVLHKDLSEYYRESITECKLVKQKKLYGFDAGKLHKFILLKFKNTTIMNKVKNLWFTKNKNYRKRRLYENGYKYKNEYLQLYEAKLPPLLRFFHITEISPSGWIEVDEDEVEELDGFTTCDFQYATNWSNVKALQRETIVPFKIMSFDIEASSSHGDFPLAKKTYRKPIGEMIEYYTKNKKKVQTLKRDERRQLFKDMMLCAFGYCDKYNFMSQVYTKRSIKKEEVDARIEKILEFNLGKLLKKKKKLVMEEEELDEVEDDDEIFARKKKWHPTPTAFHRVKNKPVFECLFYDFDSGDKLDILDRALEYNPQEKEIAGYLPPLEGDKCTFIGSTFLRVGEKEPYFNHMIALNSCNKMTDVENSKVESYRTEKSVLLAWQKIIQRENPDIIIGYNIFGFDWAFMIERANELKCLTAFRQLSRKTDFDCRIIDTELKVASGTHELKYMKMPGRIQIDLYNQFRKSVNLSSYKLDSVASHYIGDYIKKIECVENKTIIYTNNLTGLKNSHYICLEIIGNSTDMYKRGKKFKVKNLDKEAKCFEVDDIIELDGKKSRWCLAKDDVSPQDIFRLTNQGPDERAIVAKYCIQDCNLVHQLLLKNDIFSEFVELAAICSIPMDMAIMRGQGIRLLSFIAKKCREKETLMPVVEKPLRDIGYEGAICLPPKTKLYTDNPVACVDYSSLYPSSMISENISHDSKVSTIEYDLDGQIEEDAYGNPSISGERNSKGEFIYDNLPGYEYVNITYDRYEWVKKTGKKDVKVKVGTKTCRYAQLPDDKKSIMPSVLKGLLAARKATRAKIKFKRVTLKDGSTYEGVVSKNSDTYTIQNIYLDNEELKKDKTDVSIDDVETIEDAYDAFMKSVFNNRQLAIKVVANSLYGQCGAKTSSFFEMDIAASTTATGRKLLIYAKKVIEDVYGDNTVEVEGHGKVKTKAEYIYGDTDSVFFTFNFEDLSGNPIRGKKALEMTIILAQEAGELATKFLKDPHDLEYEKTFMPFLLLSKKRYVGILYELDPNKGKRKEMGIVLKRRDNAPIVKDVYGGIVDRLMNSISIDDVISYTKKALVNVVKGNVDLDKLIISKSLRGFYKNPDSIAHKVLAERIGKRDAGKKPSVGSRVPYVYIQTKGKVKLQGDKIESPEYIRENQLQPDYIHYITNQIQKPVTQIFSLLLEDIPEFKKKIKQYHSRVRSLQREYRDNEKKYVTKLQKLKDDYVAKLIFNKIIKSGQCGVTKTAMKNFFNK